MINLVVRIVTTVKSGIIHVKTCVMCMENTLLLSTEKTHKMSDRLTCSSEEEEIPNRVLVVVLVVKWPLGKILN